MPARPDEVWKTSALAALYLEGVRGAIPLAPQQVDVMLRLIEAVQRPVRSFLDLGCGDGVLASALLERFPDARSVLVDFSEPMLAAARERLRAANTLPLFVLADYGMSSWTQAVEGAAPYDAIISGYSIHHQPDVRKREVYTEIFGLLASGGVFVNVEHVASPSPWAEAVHDRLFVDHLACYHRNKSRDEVSREYYNRPDKAANILAPVEMQCRWLREIGFADVDCYFKIFELAVFGGRRP